MLPHGRNGNRNKAKTGARNYAKVCDLEEATKTEEKDEQPDEKNPKRAEKHQKRNFAMMGMMPTGRTGNAGEKLAKVKLRGSSSGGKNVPFET